MGLQVTAVDKASNKTQDITITSADRTSQDKIEQMVADAEKYAADDKKQADRVAAKNGLESYAYQLKNSVDEEALKDKLSPEDKKKELESVANPIMTKMYQGAQGGAQGGMPNMGDMPNISKNSNGGAGPTIEEVD